ncbi:FadR/GntR family transcriptional regulator [Oceaniglobus trochenteri]|uniref:FadR/GntR family transcriptional regulator n=1 Tax=Oceaniglobus trochenteri TaxID=2763260 RepID=UPI001CFFBDF3
MPDQAVTEKTRARGKAGKGTHPKDVTEALIALIDTLQIGVGERLPPEISLAQRLNVGRSTVREALKAWQNMGIVVRNKGAGTTLMVDVSHSIHVPLTLKLEAESLLRTQGVRMPLEIEAVRLAAINASDEQRRRIVDLGEAVIATCAAGEDWRDADAAFHGAIHDASGNPLFGQLIAQIQMAFRQVYEAPLGQPQLGERSIPMHRDLARAIAERDTETAVRVTRDIMNIVETEIRTVIHGTQC